jgi:hypothetical protein
MKLRAIVLVTAVLVLGPGVLLSNTTRMKGVVFRKR